MNPVRFSNNPNLIFSTFILLLQAACATSKGPSAKPVERTGVQDVAIRQMILDIAQGEACSKLKGRFVGLPEKNQAQGADRGLVPSAGRWYVRDCTSRVEDNRLILSIGGIGWSWVDESKGGLGIKQYVFFSANTTLKGQVDIGYDAQKHLASVWVSPDGEASSSVQALGHVNVRAENTWGTIKSGLAKLFGKDVNELAKKKIGEQGASMMRDKLKEGFTLTLNTQSKQVDLLLGALANGEVPKRPFEGDKVGWVLNERQRLLPGGTLFSGPFEPASEAVIDVQLEEGQSLSYAVLCASDMETRLAQLAKGESPTAIDEQGSRQGSDATPLHVTLPACPWVLATWTQDTNGSLAKLRVRKPEKNSTSIKSTAHSLWARVQLRSFQVNAKKGDGKPWRMLGRAPSLSFSILLGGKETEVVPKMSQQLQANINLTSPIVEVSPTQPITLIVHDHHRLLGTHEVGRVIIPLSQIGDSTEQRFSIDSNGQSIGSIQAVIERQQGK